MNPDLRESRNIPAADSVIRQVNPLDPKQLVRLYLFSTMMFLVSLFALRFIEIFITRSVLRSFFIHFYYSPFSISFPAGSSEVWSENKILFTFGLVPALYLFGGLVLATIRVRNWKLNLFLTWTSFIMVSSVPAGLAAGVIFYQSLGIATAWMFNSFILQLIIGLGAIFLLVLSFPLWTPRFLKASNSARFFSDVFKTRKYIRYAITYPWLTGAMVTCLAGIFRQDWYWIVSVLLFGLVILPMTARDFRASRIKIHRSGGEIFSMRYPVIPLILLIIFLLAVSGIVFTY
jgi:hypothetical protein